MAHSGKTITFATDLLPNENGIYNLGDSDYKWKIYGNGAGITNLNASNLSSGTVPIGQLPTGTGENQVALGNHTHSYLPLTGGTITGGIVMQNTNVELGAANNGLSSNKSIVLNWYDKNNKYYARMYGRADTTGNGNLFLHAGNIVNNAQKYGGIGITMNTSGAITYSVTTPANFRTAIGVGASGTHADDYYSLAGHDHDDAYLQLTGGSLTGDLIMRSANNTLADTNNKRISWQSSANVEEAYIAGSLLGHIAIRAKNNIYFDPGSDELTSASGTLLSTTTFRPYTDNNLTLGTSERRWSAAYALVYYGNWAGTEQNSAAKVAAALVASPGAGQIAYHYHMTAKQTGCFPTTNNSNAMITFNRYATSSNTTQYNSQLGISSDGRLYYRAYQAAVPDTTKTWEKVAWASDFDTWAGSTSITTVGTIGTGTWAGSTIGVAYGGTGTTSFTANSLIMSGDSGTAALTTKAIHTLTTKGALGWNSTTTKNYIPDLSAIAYWNGAYTGTTSNLSVLGTITTGTWNATKIGTAYGGTGNTSFTASTLIYASSATQLSSATNITINNTNGRINVTSKNGSSAEFTATRGNANFWFGFGSDNTNHGIYDTTIGTGQWMIYSDGTNTYLPEITYAAGCNIRVRAHGTYGSGSALKAYNDATDYGALLYHNTSNLWIGAGATNTDVHVGGLYLHAGKTAEGIMNRKAFLAVGASSTATTATAYMLVYGGTNGNAVGGATTGPVYINTIGHAVAVTSVPVTKGGTGTTTAPTQGGVIYASSTTTYDSTAAGTAGQVLVSGGTGAPTWSDGTNLSLSMLSSISTNTLTTIHNITCGGNLLMGSTIDNPTHGGIIDAATNVKCNRGIFAGHNDGDISHAYYNAALVIREADRQETSSEIISGSYNNRWAPRIGFQWVGLIGGSLAFQKDASGTAGQYGYFGFYGTDGQTCIPLLASQFNTSSGSNDYAEYRLTNNSARAGQCVIDTDDGSLVISTARLQPGAQIVSDTYGFTMGQDTTHGTPVAVSGRVLAIPYRNRSEYHAGMAVCSAPNGTIDIMTREEIRDYPDCIVGIVSEIPSYGVWHNVQVNGRIWIKV